MDGTVVSNQKDIDDAILGSCFELKATDRKSRASHVKKNAWPIKRPG
jgi:hypothetical protein